MIPTTFLLSIIILILIPNIYTKKLSTNINKGGILLSRYGDKYDYKKRSSRYIANKLLYLRR